MYRYITLERAKREKDAMATHRTMIIGAGAAGQMILRELKTSVKATAKPCCVIDDNPNKWGRLTEGVPIVGGRDSIMANVEKYNIDQILLQSLPHGWRTEEISSISVRKQNVNSRLCGSIPAGKRTGFLKQDESSSSRRSAWKRSDQSKHGRDLPVTIKGKTILVTGGVSSS